MKIKVREYRYGKNLPELVEVEAKPPFEMYGAKFAVYRRRANPRWWTVVEVSTGLGMGILCKTMREAVATAKERLALRGEVVVTTAIEKALRAQRKEDKK